MIELIEKLADMIPDYIGNELKYNRIFEQMLAEVRWVTDRVPTPEELESAGDCGIILCVSGEIDFHTYDHAIVMDDLNDYCNGVFYVQGVQAKEDMIIHGWMLPPAWEGVKPC